MSLETHEQIFELLEKSQSPLILLRPDYSVDGLAGGLALKRILTSMGKENVTITSHDFKLPKKLAFFPGSETVQNSLENVRQFVISLDVSKTKVDTISYNVKDDHLDFMIRPKDGTFQDSDVSTRLSGGEYDLVITLNTPDLESLGTLYDNDTDFFFETPIVNIDHRPDNERYGQINLVDIVASSSSEIIAELFVMHNKKIIDEDTATLLLAGMMAETKSWHVPNVTPQALSLAGDLMEAGARKEEIMNNLYRSKNLSTLHLWGRALARLKADDEHGIAWATIPSTDFNTTETTEQDLEGVVNELISISSNAPVILLLYQKKDGRVSGFLHTTHKMNAQTIVKDFNPKGSHLLARFHTDEKDIGKAETHVLEVIRKAVSGTT
jgi:phosphoesterase RecJ-like protein